MRNSGMLSTRLVTDSGIPPGIRCSVNCLTMMAIPVKPPVIRLAGSSTEAVANAITAVPMMIRI